MDEQRKYRHPYWVRFEGRKSACVMAESETEAETAAAALTGAKVTKCETLPYPADPVLNREPDDCPPFCYTPEQCVGTGCCRKSYACSE